MKTVRLNLSEKSLNDNVILAQEVAAFLSKNSDSDTDFESDGPNVIEFDLTEKSDPIYWSVGEIKMNQFGSFDVIIYC